MQTGNIFKTILHLIITKHLDKYNLIKQYLQKQMVCIYTINRSFSIHACTNVHVVSNAVAFQISVLCSFVSNIDVASSPDCAAAKREALRRAFRAIHQSTKAPLA